MTDLLFNINRALALALALGGYTPILVYTDPWYRYPGPCGTVSVYSSARPLEGPIWGPVGTPWAPNGPHGPPIGPIWPKLGLDFGLFFLRFVFCVLRAHLNDPLHILNRFDELHLCHPPTNVLELPE